MVSEQIKEQIKEFFKRMNSAEDKPAETCVEGKEHHYVTVSHADGRDHYSWYMECEHCNHMMVKKFERDKANKKLWS